VNNLNPDQAPPAFGESVLSDKADGSSTTSNTAHLTGIATASGTVYVAMEWFLCNNSTGITTTNAPGAAAGGWSDAGGSNCTTTPIATDTSATNPTGTAANSFEANFDPVQQYTRFTAGGSGSTETVTVDDTTVTIVSRACTTTGFSGTCHNETEDGVFIDDTADDGAAADQTSTGEITSPANNGIVSNGGFTATASTDSGTTSLDFELCTVTPGAEEGGCVGINDTTADPGSTASNNLFHADFSAANVLDDSTLDLIIGNSSPASDECSGGPCQYDAHYIVSTGTAASAKINFPGFKADGVTPNDTADCANSTGTGGTTFSAKSGVNTPVQGCLFSSGSTPSNLTNGLDWAFNVTPEDKSAPCYNGAIAGYGDGAETNTTPSATDACAELVNGNPGDATGGASNGADNTINLGVAGNYTLTFCRDINNDGLCGSSDTPSATGTLTITTGAVTHNHLHLATEVTADPTCHTGTSATTAAAGSVVNLTGCPQDAGHNNVPNIPVIWSTCVGCPASGFYTSTQNTTDASGHANASVSSTKAQAGTTFAATFCGDANNNGTCDAGAVTFTINWSTAPGGNRAGTSLSLVKDRLRHRTRFFGSLNTGNPNVCHVGGELIKLFRGSTLVDITHASSGGDYHFSRPHSRVRHTFHTSHPRSNDCGASRSADRKDRSK